MDGMTVARGSGGTPAAAHGSWAGSDSGAAPVGDSYAWTAPWSQDATGRNTLTPERSGRHAELGAGSLAAH